MKTDILWAWTILSLIAVWVVAVAYAAARKRKDR